MCCTNYLCSHFQMFSSTTTLKNQPFDGIRMMSGLKLTSSYTEVWTQKLNTDRRTYQDQSTPAYLILMIKPKPGSVTVTFSLNFVLFWRLGWVSATSREKKTSHKALPTNTSSQCTQLIILSENITAELRGLKLCLTQQTHKWECDGDRGWPDGGLMLHLRGCGHEVKHKTSLTHSQKCSTFWSI